MKSRFKKLLIFFLASILAISCVSCGEEGAGGGGDDGKIPSENEVFTGYDMNTGIDLKSAEFKLIGDNSSDYVIVTSAIPTEPEAYAAAELSSFLQQATKVVIEVKTEAEAGGKKFISIGKTEAFKAKNDPLDDKEMNYDGFIIKTIDNNIYICGANERGTLYGVYDFLERFAGIKFISPEDTFVPNLTEIKLHQMNIKEVPEFRQRNYYNRYVGRFPQFEARTRMYSDFTQTLPKYGHDDDWFKGGSSTIHNIFDYVPQSIYGKTHPEFFAQNEGGYDHDICYSHGIDDNGEIIETDEPTVIKIALENLKKFAKQDETAKFFMLGMWDSTKHYCDCPTCTARNKIYGERSGNVVIFMNALSRAIKKWRDVEYPGREINLIFFAYCWAEEAPVVMDENGDYKPVNDKVVLEDNIYVRIALIFANCAYGVTDSRQDIKIKKVYDKWAAVAKNFMVWDYVTYFGGYAWYLPTLNYLAENLKFYKKMNVAYIMNQSSYSTDGCWQANLNYYVASKLYWHMDRNVDELIKEYVTYYHGADAAPHVLEFIDVMENRYAVLRSEPGFKMNINYHDMPFINVKYFPQAFMLKCHDVLDGAYNAISNSTTITKPEKEEYTKRMAGVKLILQYMTLKNYDSYFSEGKKEYVESFARNATIAGFTRVREFEDIEIFINSFGF